VASVRKQTERTGFGDGSGEIHVTQVKSAIKSGTKMERTIRALGFTRMNQTVIHKDTPQVRGMIYKVRHLVRVQEVAS
jgi:large subunit ribosomal protein L30